MDNRLTSALFGHYHFLQNQIENNSAAPKNTALLPRKKPTTPQDIVTLSSQNISEGNALSQNQTQLIQETRQKIENGFRRTQEFQTAKGQNLTKIEEITTTPNQTRRTIIQQNPSGSTTRLENIFDRQENGNFRLTKRLTNEVGETQTNIEFNLPPPNLDIALGRIEEQNTTRLDKSEIKRGQALNIVV